MATAVAHPVFVPSLGKWSPLAMWHLLSLDAPTVAALWSMFFARIFGVHLSFCVQLALGIAVWMLYAADRINDALQGSLLEERHRFHLRHRRALAAAMLFILPLLVFFVFHLPRELRDLWLLLSIPLLVYSVAIHGLRLPRVPKEAVVAVFFGLATAMPVIASGVPWQQALPATLLFGALCWLNGIAISRWESVPRGTTDVRAAWFAGYAPVVGASLALTSFVQLRFFPCRIVAVAVLLSESLLLLLDHERSRLSTVHVRALADAALMTPLLIWPLLPLISR